MALFMLNDSARLLVVIYAFHRWLSVAVQSISAANPLSPALDRGEAVGDRFKYALAFVITTYSWLLRFLITSLSHLTVGR